MKLERFDQLGTPFKMTTRIQSDEPGKGKSNADIHFRKRTQSV